MIRATTWRIEIRERHCWKTYRLGNTIACFDTLGALRRYARQHCLDVNGKVRAFNTVTKEYVPIA